MCDDDDDNMYNSVMFFCSWSFCSRHFKGFVTFNRRCLFAERTDIFRLSAKSTENEIKTIEHIAVKNSYKKQTVWKLHQNTEHKLKHQPTTTRCTKMGQFHIHM